MHSATCPELDAGYRRAYGSLRISKHFHSFVRLKIPPSVGKRQVHTAFHREQLCHSTIFGHKLVHSFVFRSKQSRCTYLKIHLTPDQESCKRSAVRESLSAER